MTATIWSALREGLIEPDFLLPPRKFLREQLAAIGRDREVLRKIAGTQNGEQHEAEDDEPGMAAGEPHEDCNRGNGHDGVTTTFEFLGHASIASGHDSVNAA
jgi:hypothetical protein